MTSRIISKIKNKKAHIGIIGLGYVGLPLAIRFTEEKYKTVGFDIDSKKINSLDKGRSYIQHIKNEKIKELSKSSFSATSNFKKISKVDVIIICVPTPLGIHNEPDLSYITGTIDAIKNFLKPNQLLVLESTTYPGTTEEKIIPEIESLGFKIGKNFFVGYSPEREDPGNKKYNTKNIPKVVSGFSKNCLDICNAVYDSVVDTTVPVSTLRAAEMTKILENIHRSVNIGLMNELKMITEKMKIDLYEVIEAASTKPFGFTPYYPGPGLGGHCIPIDPFYLSWKAKEMGMDTRFIELAGEINNYMPKYVVSRIGEILNIKGKSIKNCKILVLGLAYKKNVDDLRESPALNIIDLLINMGATIKYVDPYVQKIPPTRKYSIPPLESFELNKDVLINSDLVLLTTDHDVFDYDLIEKFSSIIIDTRGRLKKSEKVYSA